MEMELLEFDLFKHGKSRITIFYSMMEEFAINHALSLPLNGNGIIFCYSMMEEFAFLAYHGYYINVHLATW